MKTFKKVLALLLVAALAAGLAIVGTVAYLTHEDEEVNVFTVGNVEVELVELQRNADRTDLEKFQDGKQVMPLVGSAQGEKDTFGQPKAANYVDKIVYARNKGASEAYMRIRIAIPYWGNDAGATANTNNLHWNYPGDTTWEIMETGISAANGEKFSTVTYTLESNENDPINIDGVNYYVYTFTFDKPIEPGYATRVVMGGLYLDSNVDYDPATGKYEAPDGTTFDIPNGTINVPVIVEAVQASGFANADAAFDAANFPTNPWAQTKVPVVVKNADGLIEGLEAGKDVILANDVKIDPAGMSNAYGTTGINVKNGQTIDGAGNTLDIKGAGGTWDSGINTTGGIIRNITVTGSFRGIFINHNSTHSEPVILDNVIIDGTTYTISCDQGMYQTLTATNSTFKGWTSYAATLGNARFIDCYFGAGSGYNFSRPYAPTAYVGCDFEAGHQMDPRAAVTFENCTIGGVPLTADNLATLVTYNIQNATVIG